MRAWKLFLPLVVLLLAGIGLAQDSNSASVASDVPPEDVIVPWRHFGPDPASLANAYDPPAPQGAAVSSGTSDPQSDAPTDPPSSGEQTSDPQNAQASTARQNAQVYEADISKKHPHPPEPVQLPAAAQPAPPLTQGRPAVLEISPALAGKNSQSDTKGQPAAGNTAPATPESQILALTASYQEREASRAAELQQLKATAVNDPSTKLRAQIQETQLLYEGAQDHMQSAQQLSKAYASLAGDLEDRAGKVRDLAESREQGAQAAEAELSQMKEITPKLHLALHNFAMLPPDDGNNQMIGTLKAELTQDESTRKFNQERSAETQNEMKTLQADAQRLEQAASAARQKSASYAEESQEAQAQEGLLSDKLEYLAARQSAADLLASASKVLGTPADGGNRASKPSTTGYTTPPSSPGGQGIDSLRACLRKGASADACLAKKGP